VPREPSSPLNIFNQHRCLFLLGAILVLILTSPLKTYGDWAVQLYLAVLWSLGIGLGGYLIVRRPHWLLAMGMFVGIATLLYWARAVVGPNQWIDISEHIVVLAILASTSLIVLRHALFISTCEPKDRILGGICVYFLMALMWARTYMFIAEFDPQTILVAGESISKPYQYIYFSLTTLTTLGYGDIIPENPYAKLLAAIESAVGVIYLAVLMASLVGKLASPDSRKGSPLSK
jgi:hypothetical protein